MKFLLKLTTVLFLMLVVASLLFLCPSDAWRRRRRRRRNPPVKTPPVRTPPPRTFGRLPYCPLDPRVKIITQKRFGRELHEYKRRTTWPYKCEYASILKVKGVFNYLPLIHRCCNSCNFPKYSTCLRSYAASASWRCPSEGLQCIVTCVRKHDPNTKRTTTPAGRWNRRFRKRTHRLSFRRVRPRIKNSKCERKVRKNGRNCIERLCIPIKPI